MTSNISQNVHDSCVNLDMLTCANEFVCVMCRVAIISGLNGSARFGLSYQSTHELRMCIMYRSCCAYLLTLLDCGVVSVTSIL